jgi:hypothetical protein
MFGDHLPTLGEDYEIYRQLGFASEGPLTDADYNNLYTTPFVTPSTKSAISSLNSSLI